jgi:hypothetical protein
MKFLSEVWAAKKKKKKLFWVGFFFINSPQSSKSYHQLEKNLRHMQFTREILKNQLHLCKKLLGRCS